MVNSRRAEGLNQVGGTAQAGEEDFTALQLSFIRESLGCCWACMQVLTYTHT